MCACVCRKRSVLVSNIPAILGATVSVLCVRFSMPELLMIGRFITGINCGTPCHAPASLLVRILNSPRFTFNNLQALDSS